MDTIEPLYDVSNADVTAWHRVIRASVALDLPEEPPPGREHVGAQMTDPGLGSRRLRWQARGLDGVSGVGGLRLFDDTGRDHLAELTLHVHPDRRRAGLGARLLAAAAGAAAAEGRRSLVVEASSDTPAIPFLENRGFGCVLSLSLQLLTVPDVDADRLDRLVGEGHPGYHLTRWVGPVPDTLAVSFAEAKSSMGDMPGGDMDYGTVSWDADRVREMAEVVRARGDTLLTVAAVYGDMVAGFTELVVPDGERAVQYDTAVVPVHRGSGLGLWVKAAMLAWVRADHPGVTEIETDNAEDNAHMLAVNERLGFRRLRETRQYQSDPAAVVTMEDATERR